MEAAQAEAAADPTNKDKATAAAKAKKAYDDAKAAADADGSGSGDQDGGEGGGDSDDDDSLDETKLDEKTKKYLAKLRKENAGHRTKNKTLNAQVRVEQDRVKAVMKAAGIPIEEEKPEEVIANLTNATQAQALRNAILESAVQNQIPADQLEYYEFLITKRTSEMEEGEELSDEDLAAIVTKVKKAGGKPASTTVGGKGAGGSPKPGDKGEVSFEQFCAMGILAKSKFYEANPTKYTEFATLAKAKRKLI